MMEKFSRDSMRRLTSGFTIGGSGGGCLSIETTLKDVEGATREEWEKEARDCWLAVEMQPCAVNDVIDAILRDIEEIGG